MGAKTATATYIVTATYTAIATGTGIATIFHSLNPNNKN